MISIGVDLPSFLVIATIVIVTPGQDTALTVRNVLLGGRVGGVYTSGGVAVGQAVWAVGASAGVTAVLTASRPAFVALRLAGAAYLAYLGGRSLLSALRGVGDVDHVDIDARRSRRSAFRQGLVSNLSNPKMAIFFVSLLPQFVDRGAPWFAAMLSLGLLFSLMTLLWLCLYAVVVARAAGVLRRGRVRRTLEGVTGAALLALGVRIAAESR